MTVELPTVSAWRPVFDSTVTRRGAASSGEARLSDSERVTDLFCPGAENTRMRAVVAGFVQPSG